MSRIVFYPEIGDVLIIDGKRYVLFDDNFDYTVSTVGGTYFKVAYYFISEDAIIAQEKIGITELKKNEKTLVLERDDGFDIEMRTNDHYEISQCVSLLFRRKC